MRPCLFAVHGNSRQMRRKRIETIAELEPIIGFLASVFDFEWMVRRAILALSASPTAVIKVWFRSKHGLDDYKEAWVQFVDKPPQGIPFLLRNYDKSKHVEWSVLKDAFEQRHPLVHGINGFLEDDVAKFNIQLFLTASEIMESILQANGKSAFKTIPVRRAKTNDDDSARKTLAANRKISQKRHSRIAQRVNKAKNSKSHTIA